MKTFDVVANEQAAQGKTAARAASYHGKHIHNGALAQEVIRSVVEDEAHGVFCTAHDALHTINRSEIVTTVDAVTSASADQNVFVVVRHPDHFVWHHLPQREHKIEAAVCNQTIHLRRPWVI